MSAFIVSEACMHRCVKAMLPDEASCEEGDELGRKLFAMNQRAVQARYGVRKDGYDAVPEYRYVSVIPDRYAALKALCSLKYQCSEGDVPEEPLYKELSEAVSELALKIAMSAPEYERAAWG